MATETNRSGLGGEVKMSGLFGEEKKIAFIINEESDGQTRRQVLGTSLITASMLRHVTNENDKSETTVLH